jgi:hypothetical protein
VIPVSVVREGAKGFLYNNSNEVASYTRIIFMRKEDNLLSVHRRVFDLMSPLHNDRLKRGEKGDNFINFYSAKDRLYQLRYVSDAKSQMFGRSVMCRYCFSTKCKNCLVPIKD